MIKEHIKNGIALTIVCFLIFLFGFSSCNNSEMTNKKNDKEVLTNTLTCTLSVRCDTAVGKCPEKENIIPEDGIIYPETKVEFFDGESVFDILKREMQKAKIHLEFNETPIYKTAYIEGIGNLYEFDCGELSGWMYRVNGEFPGIGCSSCYVKCGDVIEFVYSCDLGEDLGEGK